MLLVILTERFICLACEICLSKTNISYISDRVDRIVGSTSTCNSSELNDSGDQAADSQQEEAEEMIPESSTEKDMTPPTCILCHVPWHNIHVEM